VTTVPIGRKTRTCSKRFERYSPSTSRRCREWRYYRFSFLSFYGPTIYLEYILDALWRFPFWPCPWVWKKKTFVRYSNVITQLQTCKTSFCYTIQTCKSEILTMDFARLFAVPKRRCLVNIRHDSNVGSIICPKYTCSETIGSRILYGETVRRYGRIARIVSITILSVTRYCACTAVGRVRWPSVGVKRVLKIEQSILEPFRATARNYNFKNIILPTSYY